MKNSYSISACHSHQYFRTNPTFCQSSAPNRNISNRCELADEIEVSVRIGSIGTTSFVLEYELLDRESQLVGKAKTVHVAVSRETQRKMILPEKLQRALKEFQSAP